MASEMLGAQAASLAHANVNDLDPWFMPFTANRAFKKAPRLMVAAEGMYYTSKEGRKILDASAGLWCVNAGHGNKKITEAMKDLVTEANFDCSTTGISLQAMVRLRAG